MSFGRFTYRRPADDAPLREWPGMAGRAYAEEHFAREQGLARFLGDCGGVLGGIDIVSIGRRLFFLAYVERVDSCRVISLRKANDREVRRYAET